jgi:hypothetical protein
MQASADALSAAFAVLLVCCRNFRTNFDRYFATYVEPNEAAEVG